MNLISDGQRLYLNEEERRVFIETSKKIECAKWRGFCLTIALTGCRISEALECMSQSIDVSHGVLILRTLKQRENNIYRGVPIPGELIDLLRTISCTLGSDQEIWPWSRSTAYLRVKSVMATSGIHGLKACPKGLRHGFGIACIENDIDLGTVKKWLGHARLETTLRYTAAVGKEERRLAERLWKC